MFHVGTDSDQTRAALDDLGSSMLMGLDGILLCIKLHPFEFMLGHYQCIIDHDLQHLFQMISLSQKFREDFVDYYGNYVW